MPVLIRCPKIEQTIVEENVTYNIDPVIPLPASDEDILISGVSDSGESMARGDMFGVFETPLTLEDYSDYVVEFDVTINVNGLYSNHWISFQPTETGTGNWLAQTEHPSQRIIMPGGDSELTWHQQLAFHVFSASGHSLTGIGKLGELFNATAGAWSISNGRVYKALYNVGSHVQSPQPEWFDYIDITMTEDSYSVVVPYDKTRVLLNTMIYLNDFPTQRAYTETALLVHRRMHNPEGEVLYSKSHHVADYKGRDNVDSYGSFEVDEDAGTVTFNARGGNYVFRSGKHYRVVLLYQDAQ